LGKTLVFGVFPS